MYFRKHKGSIKEVNTLMCFMRLNLLLKMQKEPYSSKVVFRINLLFLPDCTDVLFTRWICASVLCTAALPWGSEVILMDSSEASMSFLWCNYNQCEPFKEKKLTFLFIHNLSGDIALFLHDDDDSKKNLTNKSKMSTWHLRPTIIFH